MFLVRRICKVERKEIWKVALKDSDSLWYDNLYYSAETPTLWPVK